MTTATADWLLPEDYCLESRQANNTRKVTNA